MQEDQKADASERGRSIDRLTRARPEQSATVSFPGDNDRVANMAQKLLAASARADAQAAVIERVRMHVHDYALSNLDARNAIAAALVAAPEQTVPKVYPPGTRGSSANTELGSTTRIMCSFVSDGSGTGGFCSSPPSSFGSGAR